MDGVPRKPGEGNQGKIYKILKMSENRLTYLDIAKGIGIILVVIGHSISNTSFVFHFIYAFHMPLFFYISGRCFNESKYEFLSFVQKRSKTLLWPTFVFTLLLYIGYYTVGQERDFSYLTVGLPDALWFIPVLFCAEILFYPFARMLMKSNVSQRICILTGEVVVALLIGHFLYKGGIHLIYSIPAICPALSFYGIGYLMRSYGSSIEKRMNFGVFFFGMSIVAFCCESGLTTDIRLNAITPLWIGFIAAIFGIWGILGISQMVDRCESNIVKTLLMFLGEHTLIIMCLHYFYIKMSVLYLHPFITNHLVYKLVEALLVWGGLYCSILLINGYAGWMIGKKK